MIKGYKIKKIFLGIIVVLLLAFFLLGLAAYIYGGLVAGKLDKIYQERESTVVMDRDGKILFVRPNRTTYYAKYLEEIPERFKKLLFEKEDRFFLYHPGVNPFSIVRGIGQYINGRKHLTTSTITQQLVKILLENEFDRSFKNKLKETIYALSLETRFSKEDILLMYVNSVYFGNRVQGLVNASRLYFDKEPQSLNDQEIVQLLATISNPSNLNPFTIENFEASNYVNTKEKIDISENQALKNKDALKNKFDEYLRNENYFEIATLGLNESVNNCLTIDSSLTNDLREILKVKLESLAHKDVINGAIVVLKVSGKNELLAMVGSPNPEVDAFGYKINMATRPRPIGSTIKPFIYLKGFEKGLRPYSRVEDKEYKYIIDSGFAFYPKNYDYQYRGEVDLHYALSNSLNVPTVKVLEYVGLENFYRFLSDDLAFESIQPLENYQLGIALGGLEMDLTTLAYYFSSLADNGRLEPLTVSSDGKVGDLLQTDLSRSRDIAPSEYVQLVNKILSDREMGIEQFGMKSDLNLFFDNYAVKTGTSREFHDSWTIGYTPDFLVAVWVGNNDDTAMDNVSGQGGAGRIWHEAMNLLYNSKYNKKTEFDFSAVQSFEREETLVYGLKGDDVNSHLDLLLDDDLVLSPHNGDTFLLEGNTKIPLRARFPVSWSVNGEKIGEGKEMIFSPSVPGEYELTAISEEKKESISVTINKEEE